MDPDLASAVVDAVVAGAAAGAKDTATSAVKDAYAGLKVLLALRQVDVTSLERRPDSPAEQGSLREDLEGLDDDPNALDGPDAELFDAARQVIDAVAEHDAAVADAVGVDLAWLRMQFLRVRDVTAIDSGFLGHHLDSAGEVKIRIVWAGRLARDGGVMEWDLRNAVAGVLVAAAATMAADTTSAVKESYTRLRSLLERRGVDLTGLERRLASRDVQRLLLESLDIIDAIEDRGGVDDELLDAVWRVTDDITADDTDGVPRPPLGDAVRISDEERAMRPVSGRWMGRPRAVDDESPLIEREILPEFVLDARKPDQQLTRLNQAAGRGGEVEEWRGVIWIVGDEAQGEALRHALREFLADHDVTLNESGRAYRGSWWQRLKLTAGRIVGRGDVRERMAEAEQALRARYLDQQTAQNDHLKADATARLLSQLGAIEQAVIVLGQLIVVKNRSGLVVKSVDAVTAAKIERSQTLLSDPDAVVQLLSTVSDDPYRGDDDRGGARDGVHLAQSKGRPALPGRRRPPGADVPPPSPDDHW